MAGFGCIDGWLDVDDDGKEVGGRADGNKRDGEAKVEDDDEGLKDLEVAVRVIKKLNPNIRRVGVWLTLEGYVLEFGTCVPLHAILPCTDDRVPVIYLGTGTPWTNHPHHTSGKVSRSESTLSGGSSSTLPRGPVDGTCRRSRTWGGSGMSISVG